MKLKFLAFFFFLALVSCITIPVQVSLNDPPDQKQPLPLTIFIERVTLPSGINSVQTKEDNLTLALIEYARKANYFQRVSYISYKEPSDKNYKIFSIACSNFEEIRKPHPAYFPLAILTFTIYIWAGGAIATDSANYDCDLTVKNPNNKVLFRNVKKLLNTRDVNFYSKYYIFPSGIEDRTEVLSSLIDSYYNAHRFILKHTNGDKVNEKN